MIPVDTHANFQKGFSGGNCKRFCRAARTFLRHGDGDGKRTASTAAVTATSAASGDEAPDTDTEHTDTKQASNMEDPTSEIVTTTSAL